MTKPRCKLVGTNGNVFALVGKVTLALKKADQHDKVREFRSRLIKCGSYDNALALMQEYVDVE